MKRRIVSVEFTSNAIPRIMLDDGTELECLFGVKVRRRASQPPIVEVVTFLYDTSLSQEEPEVKKPEPPVRLT